MTREPRAPQLAMLQGIGRGSPRNMLIAGMGLGKTGAALLYASGLQATHGFWPGMLVMAPQQVCFAWAREVPLWRPDLKVALVMGTPAQRKAALMSSADVYCMNYEQSEWLHEELDNWSALGRLLIADESTRLKHTKASFQTSSTGKVFLRTDGGKRTNAIARHASDFTWWLNMSGTPSPKGLLDLWGQYWYLDAGRRLGTSYTAFEQRWFTAPSRFSEFAAPEAIIGAQEEILGLVADITTVVRTEDYYHLDAPVVIDRAVHMPDKAVKAYNDMRKHLCAELLQPDGTPQAHVTASTAASKAGKLLQIAAGFAYYIDEDDDPELKQCVVLHESKVDAVASILEETQEPLLLFYQHTAFLELLQKRFKKRLHTLDAKGKAQDDWNKGKIELLAIQYQSGAEGLSLQHGGRNVCFAEPTHWADKYEQAIERLGPLRQMQSGYKRSVNVFRLVAEGTEDAGVFGRTAQKLSAQAQAIAFLRSLAGA